MTNTGGDQIANQMSIWMCQCLSSEEKLMSLPVASQSRRELSLWLADPDCDDQRHCQRICDRLNTEIIFRFWALRLSKIIVQLHIWCTNPHRSLGVLRLLNRIMLDTLDHWLVSEDLWLIYYGFETTLDDKGQYVVVNKMIDYGFYCLLFPKESSWLLLSLIIYLIKDMACIRYYQYHTVESLEEIPSIPNQYQPSLWPC